MRTVGIGAIKQLALDRQALLNEAEELRAAGKVQDALARYARARKTILGQWHQALVKARQEQAVRMSGGAATTRRAGDDDDDAPAEKVDPLSSLDALGTDLATEPFDPKDREGWDQMSKPDRDEATAKYQKELADWKKKHSFKGAKVTWIMPVDQVKPGDDGVSELVCKSSKGFGLSVEVAKLDEDAKKAIDAHKPVAIAGTIKEINVQLNRSDSIFNADLIQAGVVLSDAKASLPSAASKPATQAAKP